MFKMFLRAKVPNEGARRLAWWLGTRLKGTLNPLATVISAETADRLIRGELIPGPEVAGAIERATAGAVRAGEWCDPALGSWGERPARSFGAGPQMLSPGRRVTIEDIERGFAPKGAWARAVRRLPELAAQAG